MACEARFDYKNMSVCVCTYVRFGKRYNLDKIFKFVYAESILPNESKMQLPYS